MAGRGSAAGERRGGRQKGTPNRITGDLREMVLAALDAAGGVEYLKARALDTPGPFLALVSKILPKQIDAQVRTDFKDMSDAELDAYIENDMRQLGWVPGPNGRRLVERPVPKHGRVLEPEAKQIMHYNGLHKVLSK